MSLRAVGGVLALVVAACGATEIVTNTAGAAPVAKRVAGRPGAQSTVHAAARPHAAAPAQGRTRMTVRPATVWVGADIATVWVKPRLVRPVDSQALRAHPRIARWINRQTLGQREDLDSRVMTQALRGEQLVLLKRRDGWSKVRIPDQFGSGFPSGIVGWIPTPQLTSAQPRRHVLPLIRGRHGSGTTALRLARHYLGVRYLWGGMTSAGIDCSGLTYRVYRQLGVVLPRDAADQSRVGRHVSRAALRRGDLVFFGSGSWRGVHHVGIYAGHGRLLHAPHTGTVVQVTPLRAFHDYWGARRIR